MAGLLSGPGGVLGVGVGGVSVKPEGAGGGRVEADGAASFGGIGFGLTGFWVAGFAGGRASLALRRST